MRNSPQGVLIEIGQILGSFKGKFAVIGRGAVGEDLAFLDEVALLDERLLVDARVLV